VATDRYGGGSRQGGSFEMVIEVACFVTIALYGVLVLVIALASLNPYTAPVGIGLVLVAGTIWRVPETRPLGIVIGLALCAFAALGGPPATWLWPLVLLAVFVLSGLARIKSR